MLRKVNSNAITVDPFVNLKQITPNTEKRAKTDRIKQKYLVSDKTADTLTSSITTLFHPQLPDSKNTGATPSTVDKYFYKYFTPYRRFSEKKNGNQKPSPLNENSNPFKVSSDFGSFRNSVQNIDNEQFSMSQSGTSNKEHLNKKIRMFCNSHEKLKSLKKSQQKVESNQHQEIPNEELNNVNQDQVQFITLQNKDNFIDNQIQEDPKLITSFTQNQSETSKKQEHDNHQDEEIFDIQNFESLENIGCYVKQFRLQIKKTINLNKKKNKKSQIKQYNNSEIQADIQTEITQRNKCYEQQELEDPKFNQAKSEILKPQQNELKTLTLNTNKRRFQIKCLFQLLILILFIIFYTLIV